MQKYSVDSSWIIGTIVSSHCSFRHCRWRLRVSKQRSTIKAHEEEEGAGSLSLPSLTQNRTRATEARWPCEPRSGASAFSQVTSRLNAHARTQQTNAGGVRRVELPLASRTVVHCNWSKGHRTRHEKRPSAPPPHPYVITRTCLTLEQHAIVQLSPSLHAKRIKSSCSSSCVLYWN